MLNMTKEEYNKYQREYRLSNNNAVTKKYEKTHKGFLMRCYRNMKSRVTGIQKKKSHLYKGKSLLSKVDFYKWSMKDKRFKELFARWEINKYNRKLCPSINRIDSQEGYELDNLEWITHSENSRLGAVSRHSK